MFQQATKFVVQMKFIPFSYKEIAYQEIANGDIVGRGTSGNFVLSVQYLPLI